MLVSSIIVGFTSLETLYWTFRLRKFSSERLKLDTREKDGKATIINGISWLSLSYGFLVNPGKVSSCARTFTSLFKGLPKFISFMSPMKTSFLSILTTTRSLLCCSSLESKSSLDDNWMLNTLRLLQLHRLMRHLASQETEESTLRIYRITMSKYSTTYMSLLWQPSS